MTKKEKQQEQSEIREAVKVLMAACRSMANRKARQYEHDFLLQVRDEIDKEIGMRAELDTHFANYIADEVKEKLLT